MKKLCLTLVACVALSMLFAQNADSRVEKVTEILHGRTMVTTFDYVDDKVNTVTMTEDGKEYDFRTYSYKKENVTVNSKRMEGTLKTYSISNGVVLSYKSNKANTFTFKYDGARISDVRHEDKCNELDYGYHFVYDDKGKVSHVNMTVKAAGEKPVNVFKFYYNDNGQLQKIDEGTANGKDLYRTFTFTYDGARLSQILETGRGMPLTRFEFGYNESGNIVKQEETNLREGKEEKTRSLTISYSKAKGNDAMIWSVNHWEFNFLFGTRSYFDLPTPCY